MDANPHIAYLFDLSGCAGREEAEFIERYHRMQDAAVDQLDPDAIAAWVWLIYDFDPEPVVGENADLAFLYAVPEMARREFFSQDYGFSWNRIMRGRDWGSGDFEPLPVRELVVQALERYPVDGAKRRVTFLHHVLFLCNYYAKMFGEPFAMDEGQTRRLLVLLGRQLERSTGMLKSDMVYAVVRVPADPDYLPLFRQLILRIERPYKDHGYLFTCMAKNFFALADLPSLSKAERKTITRNLRWLKRKDSFNTADLQAMIDALVA